MYLVHGRGARFQYWLYILVGKKFIAHIKPMYLRIFLTQKGYSVAINNLLPAMHPLPSSACLWLQVGVFNRARLSFQWGEGTGQDFQHVQVIQTVATTTRYVYICIIYTHMYILYTLMLQYTRVTYTSYWNILFFFVLRLPLAGLIHLRFLVR